MLAVMFDVMITMVQNIFFMGDSGSDKKLRTICADFEGVRGHEVVGHEDEDMRLWT